jgi:hypothetical protein
VGERMIRLLLDAFRRVKSNESAVVADHWAHSECFAADHRQQGVVRVIGFLPSRSSTERALRIDLQFPKVPYAVPRAHRPPLLSSWTTVEHGTADAKRAPSRLNALARNPEGSFTGLLNRWCAPSRSYIAGASPNSPHKTGGLWPGR